MNSQNNKQKPVSPQFKDVSRFTRMINSLDDQDKALNPRKRKRKWLLVFSFLFLLYLVSFLLPSPELSHQGIEPSGIIKAEDSIKENIQYRQNPLDLEMPVDSFENLLKQRINESLPEKK